VLGILFESLAQIQLQNKVDLNLVRMVKESSQRGNDKWTFRPSSDTSSQATSSRILFEPEDTEEYAGSQSDAINEGVFYASHCPRIKLHSIRFYWLAEICTFFK